MSAVTITFGERVENHAGMQMLGNLATEGFGYDELVRLKSVLRDDKMNVELLNMSYKGEKACVLIIRNGVSDMLEEKAGADDMLSEQTNLTPDTKAFMYGKVVNKHARHNLCFAEESQEPDYESGKGRVVAIDDVPVLQRLRNILPTFLGEKARDLLAEGNYYYDVTKCGIGYHGDTERRIVIGVRLGASIPLMYRWYYNGKRVDKAPYSISLQHGDVYVMSEKATGCDWKRKTIYTLRHAAGCDKFTK